MNADWKRKYYVSPEMKEVLEQKDESLGAGFQYEIEATPEQATELQKLLDQMEQTDFELFVGGHLWAWDETDRDNDDYDYALRKVFQRINEWGTEQTKRQLQSIQKNIPTTLEEKRDFQK